MAERSYRGLFWGLAVAGVALDQVGKYGIFTWLYHNGQGGQQEVVPGVFRLVAAFSGKTDPGGVLAPLRTWGGEILPMVNHGALFGLGNRPGLANWIFAFVSIVAAVGIIYWSTRRATARDGALCAALGLILAGTLGNLYDRLVFDGVRDFLHFYLIDWPVFNIADCCLVCGAFLLLAQAFWGRPATKAQSAAQAEQARAMAAPTK
jgi:signal peptidase II